MKDDESFRRIYSSHVRKVTAFALKRCSPEDAAEAVSETFLIVWKKMDQVPDGVEALPWIYGVCRNVIRNRLRMNFRAKRLGSSLKQHFVEREPDSSVVEINHDVEKALRTLKDSEREILQLAIWDDLKPKEIAIVLGEPQAAVRVKLHRARKKLAEKLPQYQMYQDNVIKIAN